MLVLTVAKGPDRGAVFELRDRSDFRAVIGRNSPDLKLNDIMISRHHARLKYDGRRWILRDLGSRNGTKLNGELMAKPAVLKTGDLIKTGYTEFAVRLVAEDNRDDANEAASQSHVDVAGAASSGFISAAVASGEIDHPIAGASGNKSNGPDDSTGEGSSGYVPAALASGEINTPPDAEPVDADVNDDADVPAPPPAAVPEMPRAAAKAQPAPVAKPPAAAANPPGERPASEWKSAIESQIVVIDKQGWDDLDEEEEEDGFIAAVTGSAEDGQLQPLDDDERSQLYLDEDDHWAEDVPLDDDELINSLKEDGPDALLRDLARTSPASAAVAVDAVRADVRHEAGDQTPQTGGKAKKKRKK